MMPQQPGGRRTLTLALHHTLVDRAARGYALSPIGKDTNMTAPKGFVVPAGGGKHFASPTPGRSFALKLLGRDTGEGIMMLEETVPAGTKSLHHLHHESDEVAWVLAGEITFKIGDEVTGPTERGCQTARAGRDAR